MSLRPKSCDSQGQGYIGTFLSKELSVSIKKFMPSHITRNELGDPKSSEMFCA